MKITCDWKTFTFSDITFDEFRAIRKFMNDGKELNSIRQDNNPKTLSHVDSIAFTLAEQIDNVTLPGY